MTPPPISLRRPGGDLQSTGSPHLSRDEVQEMIEATRRALEQPQWLGFRLVSDNHSLGAFFAEQFPQVDPATALHRIVVAQGQLDIAVPVPLSPNTPPSWDVHMFTLPATVYIGVVRLSLSYTPPEVVHNG